jgi:DNA gyrase/topoisomerase IV subunit B
MAKDKPDLFDSGSASSKAYTAKDIEVLEGLEPVRRRPGMYIGGTDVNALHHLAAEIIDNSMDEAVAGHATRIELELQAGKVQEQVGAGSHHDHPACRRQIRRQGI